MHPAEEGRQNTFPFRVRVVGKKMWENKIKINNDRKLRCCNVKIRKSNNAWIPDEKYPTDKKQRERQQLDLI